MSTALGEIGTEAVAPHIFHFVLVRKRGNCGGGIFPVERFIEEDKISETAANRESRLLKRLKIGLELEH